MFKKLQNRLWLLLFTASPALTYGQFAVDSGTFFVSAGSTISIGSHFVNQGVTSLQGRAFVTGDVRNNQFLNASTGTLILIGKNQTIASPPLEIGTLEVRQEGEKTFLDNIIIQQSLLLESGTLHPQQILSLATDAQVVGGSERSYVDGFLYHTGTGTKFYPIGREGTYAPVTLQGVLGNQPTVGVAYFPTPAFNGSEQYWQQRVLTGSYDGSVATLTFTSNNLDYASGTDELMVLAAELESNDYVSLGQQSLRRQGNQYTITSAGASALPILTVGFDVSDENQNLFIPNAFSPTAPSSDDQRIRVYGQQISSQNFFLSIQDAWGNTVYQTTSWEEASTVGWGGSSSASTTYRYLLRGEFIGGQSFQKSGNITQY